MRVRRVGKPFDFSETKVLYGINRQILAERQIVGYCCSEFHRGYLTKHIIKTKGCVRKNCPSFLKHEGSNYWKAITAQEERKRISKEEIREEKKRQKGYLRVLHEITANDKNLYVVSLVEENGTFLARCVTLGPVDFSIYIRVFRDQCNGARLIFKVIKASENVKKEIIRKNGLSK